jgi:hypothetical protein
LEARNMALLSEQDLRARATGFDKLAEAALSKSIKDHAAQGARFDVFLSHSALDKDVIRGLWHYLQEEFGFSVYVDWIIDPDLDRAKVTPATAERLRKRLGQSSVLLYAASLNSQGSKWMPWELGYFDALRSRAAVIPVSKTSQPNEVHKGIEYLGLYPYVTEEGTNSGKMTLWVNRDETTYVWLKSWVEGKNPVTHSS